MNTPKFKQNPLAWLRGVFFLNCVGVLTLAAGELLPAPLLAAVLSDWGLDPNTNQLEILVEQETQPRISVFNQPPRIIIDLPNTKLAVKPINEYYEGAVRQIQIEQLSAGGSRIILEFQPDMVLDPARVNLQKLASQVEVGAFRDRWVVRPAFVERGAPAPFPAADSPGRSVEISVPPPPPLAGTPFRGSSPSNTLPGLPVDMSGIPSRTVAPSVVVPAIPPRPAENRAPVARSEPGVLLPKGTVLNLRYSGSQIVALERNVDRQEVLLLNEAIRDRAGNVIIPADTPAIGRFETDRKGSRFIVQALALYGRNVSVSARSERLRHLLVLDPGELVQVSLTETLR